MIQIRRTLATAMACTMLLGGAAAEGTAPTIDSVLEGQDVDVTSEAAQPIFTIMPGDDDFAWALYRLEDGEWLPVETEKGSGEYVSGTGEAGGDAVQISWDYWFNGDWTASDGGVQHRLEVMVGEDVVTSAEFYVNFFAQRDFDRISLESWQERDDGTIAPEEEVWYVDNTVCAFGPALRDVKPGLTSKWYTAAVVDLSVQGTQSFDLIGAGAWKLGVVTVKVDGDTVVVDYQCTEDRNKLDTWDEIRTGREYVMLYADVEAIESADPAQVASPFAFGTPFSAAEMFGEDTQVILYVNNIMSYNANSPYVTRFWPNLPANAAIRQGMLDMLAE